ncbi:MAG TPA: NlpC/P60 family protein [Terriglobales bacterium]|nr:NlpC/P60 family protein [Terriglobales bacterium]
MRAKGRGAGWLILLWAATSCVLSAQTRPSLETAQGTERKSIVPAEKRLAPRLLDSDQGLAILGAALESRRPAHAGADCSHLVHAIYEKAGFPYAYASSSDLYAGTDEFRRVAQPRAGDLVVWPGHAGIVVSPGQHTFYSALRSGFGVQAYDSAYWKGRGHPHFFRYVRSAQAPVLTASNRSPSLKPTGFANDGSREGILSKTEGRVPEGSGEGDDSESRPEAPPPAIPTVPSVLIVESVRPKPDQVRSALFEEFQEAADALLGQDVFQLYPSLVAFDHFEVKKVQIKGDQGWAEIRISELSPINGPGTRSKKRPPVQRWILRRQNADRWELALPTDAIYLPRETAVRILAHQLAALTDANSETNGGRDEKARLAQWLDVLLAESPAR